MNDHSVRILSDRLINHLHSEPAVSTAPVPSTDDNPRVADAGGLLFVSGVDDAPVPCSQAAEPGLLPVFDAFTRHRAALEEEDAVKDAEIARLFRDLEIARFAATENARTIGVLLKDIAHLKAEIAKRDHRIGRMEDILR